MIIRMKGEPKELAEFAKAMQWPITVNGCDLGETMEPVEAEEVDQAEVEKEVKRLFDAAKAVTGESRNFRPIIVELHQADLVNLLAEANKRGVCGAELAGQIVEEWLDKQKKARV